MKRLSILLAATAMSMLGACSGEPPVSVQNATEATIDNLEAQANALEAKAAAQVNEGDEDLSNAAAAFDAAQSPDNIVAANMN